MRGNGRRASARDRLAGRTASSRHRAGSSDHDDTCPIAHRAASARSAARSGDGDATVLWADDPVEQIANPISAIEDRRKAIRNATQNSFRAGALAVAAV